jgi:sigma-B regulation protein RsbU (phosphoserine phosphatase)
MPLIQMNRTFQPKQFYRDLEELLHQDERVLSAEWYPWVAREIVARFGETLSIDSWRLYEEDIEGYAVTAQGNSRDSAVVGMLLPQVYAPIQLVLEHGTYIFDGTVAGQSSEIESRLGGGLESAALLLNTEPPRILAFGLRPGWERDNLDFTLNTLRNAINLRIRLHNFQMDREQAAEIQRSLLPDRTPPFPGFTMAGRSVPAETVDGDFFDFLLGNAETLLFSIGDASGHGIGAALLARDVVTGLRMGAESAVRITEVVARLNRVIARSRLSSRFASLFFGELDVDGSLAYVNAGHPPGWIFGEGRVERLRIGGTILGPLAEARFRRGWAHLSPGDALVVVTDGLLERVDASGKMFGDAGVERALASGPRGSAAEILANLFATADAHSRGRPVPDDTTAIVIAHAADAPSAPPPFVRRG